MPDGWIEFRPQHTPHVVGYYTPRTFVGGMPEEQKWRVLCEQCGATFRGVCMSGNVRSHITRFAVVHAHRDPLAPKEPRR